MTNIKVDQQRLIYPDLSYKIVGVLFKVHSELGLGYQEKYYARAIEQDFVKIGLKFQKEISVDLKYNGNKIGKYFFDFVIEDKIVLEIKALPSVSRRDFRQISAYLKSSGLKLGILANFGEESLRFFRILNSKSNK